MISNTQPARIVAAVACHIADRQQLLSHQVALESFLTGHTKSPNLAILSWSAPADLYEEALAYFNSRLAEQGTSTTSFVFLDFNGQLRQFVHYQKINQYLIDNGWDQYENTWMIFGDADDKWDESRIEYKASVQLRYPTKTVLVFPWHFDEKSLFHISDDGQHFEYWHCFVAYSVFASFFGAADNFHLQSVYCDLAFCAHLRRQGDSFFVYSVKYSTNPKYQEYLGTTDDWDKECDEYWLYEKNGTGHMGQFINDSHRLNCIRLTEIQLMKSFPVQQIEPWHDWTSIEELHEGPVLFTLQRSLDITGLVALQQNGNDYVLFNSAFRPLCCNEHCTSGSANLQVCAQCLLPRYCCESCRITCSEHKCGQNITITHQGIDDDVFSEHFNHHMDTNVDRVKILRSI